MAARGIGSGVAGEISLLIGDGGLCNSSLARIGDVDRSLEQLRIKRVRGKRRRGSEQSEHGRGEGTVFSEHVDQPSCDTASVFEPYYSKAGHKAANASLIQGYGKYLVAGVPSRVKPIVL